MATKFRIRQEGKFYSLQVRKTFLFIPYTVWKNVDMNGEADNFYKYFCDSIEEATARIEKYWNNQDEGIVTFHKVK